MNLLKTIFLVIVAIIAISIIATLVIGLIKFALILGVIGAIVWVFKKYNKKGKWERQY